MIKTGTSHNPYNKLYCHCKVSAVIVGWCAHIDAILINWVHNRVLVIGMDTFKLLVQVSGWFSQDSFEKVEKEL